jgi:hypothetical protein
MLFAGGVRERDRVLSRDIRWLRREWAPPPPAVDPPLASLDGLNETERFTLRFEEHLELGRDVVLHVRAL